MGKAIRWPLALIVGFVLSLSACPAWAADPFSEPLERIQVMRAEHVVSLRVIGLKTGPAGQVELELRTRAGVRLYASKVRATYDDGSGFPPPATLSANPPAVREFDKWYQEERDLYLPGTIFTITGPSFERGRELRFHFEACNEKLCLMPATYVMRLTEGAVGLPLPEEAGVASEKVPAADAPSLKNVATPVATKAAAGIPETGSIVVTATSTPLVAEGIATPDSALGPELVAVPAAAARAASGGSGLSAANDFLVAKVREGGLLLLPFLFLAGLLMNLTPCVYPMIPITLAVLGRTGGGKAAWRMSALYVLGMALAYAGMGVAVALTGGLFGSLLQSPWVTLAVALLMLFLGLAMLGVVDLSRIQNLGSRLSAGNHSPVVSVLLMGGVSGLVSAPCTGPVLATLLLLVSQTADAMAGFVLLFVFALGFGAPYFLLGLFSSRVRRMPRVGFLGELVKVLFAALMFGLAVYFARNFLRPLAPWLFERPTFAAWIVAGLTALSALVLDWRMSRSGGVPARLSRVASVAAVSLLALWATLSTLKAYVDTSVIRWESSLEEGMRRANAEGKALVVDLWADWCAACKEMDVELWTDPDVANMINERFVAVKVDFSTQSDATRELARRWKLGGLPAVGFFPKGAAIDAPPAVLFREKVDEGTFFPAARKVLGE